MNMFNVSTKLQHFERILAQHYFIHPFINNGHDIKIGDGSRLNKLLCTHVYTLSSCASQSVMLYKILEVHWD